MNTNTITYLTGATNPLTKAVAANRPDLGILVTPNTGTTSQIDGYHSYAADNGCFNDKTYVGDDAFLDWVGNLPSKALFVAVPDVARQPDGTLGGDPVATWDRFQALAPFVRGAGQHPALVGQDGMEDLDYAKMLSHADAFFIGGSTDWKLSPAVRDIVSTAKYLGKHVHMGRVNSLKRLRYAQDIGCDTADGTYLAFGPKTNLPKLTSWLDQLNGTPDPQLALAA